MGPAVAAKALVVNQILAYRLALPGGAVVSTSPRLEGVISAAPAAWRQRNATSTHTPPLNAAARLAAVNKPSPRRKAGLRP
jgi:hypothetical protein